MSIQIKTKADGTKVYDMTYLGKVQTEWFKAHHP